MGREEMDDRLSSSKYQVEIDNAGTYDPVLEQSLVVLELLISKYQSKLVGGDSLELGIPSLDELYRVGAPRLDHDDFTSHCK